MRVIVPHDGVQSLPCSRPSSSWHMTAFLAYVCRKIHVTVVTGPVSSVKQLLLHQVAILYGAARRPFCHVTECSAQSCSDRASLVADAGMSGVRARSAKRKV